VRVEGRPRAVVDDTRSTEYGESGQSGESADEFQTYDSSAIDKSTWGPLWTVTFNTFPERAHKDPTVTQREAKRMQGRPKAPQRGTKAQPRRDRRSPMAPQGVARHLKGSSEEIYTKKPSDQPHQWPVCLLIFLKLMAPMTFLSCPKMPRVSLGGIGSETFWAKINGVHGTWAGPEPGPEPRAVVGQCQARSGPGPGPVPGPAALQHGRPNAMDPIALLSRKFLNGFRSGLPWHLEAGGKSHGCHLFQ
jgi:hypothetical protein